ncbi:VWA domain-containing protein, partial [Streptomyces sparsogenes]|uniref:vWA domain-containing protein n=1 Tax=Streptomyces sparsogenes TaxID=67365 RepID=UPI0033CB78FC
PNAEAEADAPAEPAAPTEADAEDTTAADAAEPKTDPEPTTEPDADAPTTEPEAQAAAVDAPNAEAEADAPAEPAAPTEADAEDTTAADAAEPKTDPEPTTEPAKVDAAEAETDPAPATDAADAAEATDAAEAEADPTPAAETGPATGEAGAAISLADVESRAPGLVSLYKSAAEALTEKGLAGRRAAVYLVLDRSGSMRNYYKDGTVQHLAEQALALSANLDDDGTVPVVFFSTDIDGTADIDLANYGGRIEELHSSLGHMGRTNYHHAIKAVIDHYKASGATDPAFVIFQTDGAPTSKPAAEKALCEAARLPIFWQFVGFGDPAAKGFDFLRKLDELAVPEKRVVDNAGFFHAGQDPRALSDAELYGQLMVEFPEWLREAREAGVLS